MNDYQALWWRQARSDRAVFDLLRRQGAAPCHLLHYLQMATEKLGKAYFWRSGVAPPKTHASFVKFLRALGCVPSSKRQRLADVFGFRRFKSFRAWMRRACSFAYPLERLAPALAGDGENTEYPWPREAPEYAPVEHQFHLWAEFKDTGPGRQFMRVIDAAVEEFPEYG